MLGPAQLATKDARFVDVVNARVAGPVRGFLEEGNFW
jgi:hypothetical protein